MQIQKLCLVGISALLGITLCACANTESDRDEKTDDGNATTNTQKETTTDASEQQGAQLINQIVETFNATSPEPLTYKEDFTPSNKEDIYHYRAEFRLGGFRNAVGKSYLYKDNTTDVVTYGSKNEDIRIYTNLASKDDVIEFIRVVSPVLDPNLSNEELQQTLDKIGGINGDNQYYGKLGLTLSQNPKDSYSLMIKKE